jgi:predicted dehydrogenase
VTGARVAQPTGITSRPRVGLIGTSFMGRAHSRGLCLIRTLEDEPASIPDLRAICGRDPARREAMRRRFGWEHAIEDWQALVDDPAVDAVINAAPNDLHAAPTIAAARAGKHVLCEKPLARDSGEARTMYEAVRAADVVHMCGFNYRFFPAVRLARETIDRGEIGQPYHFRSRFLLASAADPRQPETPWRLRRENAGSGVVGDLLAHHVDIARYLVGEPVAVTAVTRTWAPERDGVAVDVDDAVACTIEFHNGAIGTLEASRVTPGHTLTSQIEVDGAAGSLAFDIQDVNRLIVSSPAGSNAIDVTEEGHPFAELWWPRGHGIGWGDSFVHELRHFLGAIAGAWTLPPHGATFHDGYRCAQVCDAILEAARTGRRQEIPSDVQ